MDLNKYAGQQNQRTGALTTTSMDEATMENIRQRLVAAGRHSVFPNKFDRNRPFRVSVRYDNQWRNYGTFTNIEVATCVAAVSAISLYGKAANTGTFNASVAQSHPEWLTWANLNHDIIEQADLRQLEG
jgi:hypothetical protein